MMSAPLSSLSPEMSLAVSPLRPRRRNTAPPTSSTVNNMLPPEMPPPVPPIMLYSQPSTSMPGQPSVSRCPSLQRKTFSIHTSTPSSSTQSSPQGRIRPLPPVPGMASPSLDRGTCSPRPLPRTPPTPPSAPTLASSPAPAPAPTKTTSPRASPTHMRAHTAPLVRLLTVPEAGAGDGPDSGPSPTSPLTPVPPSPATRKRRSVHKLARHFGEDVQSKLVLCAPPPPVPALPAPVPPPAPALPMPRARPREADEESVESLVFRTRKLSSPWSDDEDEGDIEKRPAQRWPPRGRTPATATKVVAEPPPFARPARHTTPTRRESRHWYEVEKGRLVEQEYADVLHKLRKLR